MFDHLNNYKFIEITVNDKLFLLDKVITKLVYIKIILLTTKPLYRMHSFRPFFTLTKTLSCRPTSTRYPVTRDPIAVP